MKSICCSCSVGDNFCFHFFIFFMINWIFCHFDRHTREKKERRENRTKIQAKRWVYVCLDFKNANFTSLNKACLPKSIIKYWFCVCFEQKHFFLYELIKMSVAVRFDIKSLAKILKEIWRFWTQFFVLDCVCVCLLLCDMWVRKLEKKTKRLFVAVFFYIPHTLQSIYWI